MGALWLAILVVLVAAGSDGIGVPREDEKQNFELKEVLDGSFSAKGLGAVWVSGDRLARYDASKGIEICNPMVSDDCEVIINNNTLAEGGRNKGVGSWKLSSNQQLLLWSYDVQSGFRHSTTAKYSIRSITDKVWYDLKDPDTEEEEEEEGSHLKTALLAGDKSVFFVSENNIIYYVDDITTLATNNTATKLPCGGVKDNYYCGTPDWVYEEEVLSSGTAMWLSKDSSYLAYGVFDDTKVKNFTFISYGFGQYTDPVTLKYPKPGTDNPTVHLEIVKRTDFSQRLRFSPPSLGEILQHVTWTSDKVVLVVWMSRIQNAVTVGLIDMEKKSLETVYSDEEYLGWLDVGAPVAISEESWVQLLPRKRGPVEDRFQRPVVFTSRGLAANPDRTTGALEGTVLYGWDSVSQRIFFQAAPEKIPSQRHVYSVSTSGTNLDLRCLTCAMNQTEEDGELCLYASASFSTNMRNVAVTCSGPGPAVVRMATVSNTGAFTWGRNWQDNKDLRDKLKKYNTPIVESNITINVGGAYYARAKLWLPSNIDRSGSKKYPMLVNVYGGPGSQQVSDAYSVNWGTHLTGSKDIIYAFIDGRGSGYQGTMYLYAIYKKLGSYEVLDQIKAAEELAKLYPFIDKERIGIWGWSYGGYATAMALAKDTENVFKCGASVAPVTDWMLYDSIYTERYMDKPLSNSAGYTAANISNKIEEFKNHSFFLLHGNADDNVHYQQAMRLARALELGDILFYEQSYPDENHSIRSVITHVYKSLDKFFEQCFEVPVPPNSASAVIPSALFILHVASIMRIFT